MTRRRGALAGLLWALGVAGVLRADVLVYQETFDNPSSTQNANVSSVGWAVHGGTNAVYRDAFADSVSVSFSPGAPDSGTTYGFASAWFGSNSSEQRTLFWTDEVTLLGLQTPAISRVRWYQGNALTAMVDRVAVNVDGAWFVSLPTPAQSNAVASGGVFGANCSPVTFEWGDYLLNAWLPLDFDGALGGSGTILGLGAGSPGALPDGSIQAIGLYVENTATGTRRMDSFAIYAVPEPGTLGLALCGAGLLARRRRRA